MRINIVVLPYRDTYFYDKYGAAVRDLQILLTLAEIEGVSITLLNRPVSIYERILGKLHKADVLSAVNIDVLDSTSFDLFGPLTRRSWLNSSIPCYLEKVLPGLRVDGALNVFLDFTPIGVPTDQSLDGWFYWYDFIDNFTKHNRFSESQRHYAHDKYSFVIKNAHLLTFVSSDCLANVAKIGALTGHAEVLTNKIFEDANNFDATASHMEYSIAEFDFGFIGFITDKIDVQVLLDLARRYKIAIYGDFFDLEVRAKLKSVENIYLFGRFHYRDIPNICSTFKVGLLPYREDKSHDGSPLKLYEYLRHLRPVLTSIDYELTDDKFIKNYSVEDLSDIELESLLSLSGAAEIIDLLREDDYLNVSVAKLLDNHIR